MNKCIQFVLPGGAGGMAAQMFVREIQNKLKSFVKENKISGYKTTHEKCYKFNVWFQNDKDITTIMLIWDSSKNYKEPIVLEKPLSENPYYGK